MQNTFWTALATSLAAALVTTFGIFVIHYFSRWGSRNTTYFMYFAAGVLISSSFLHIVPRALSMNAQAPAWLLAGFFGLHLSNRFIAVFNCDKEPGKKDYVFGLVPMLGIGLHSFIDGFIYSVTFSVSILTGYLASLGMVLHEFPEGMITYLLLLRAGFNERSSAMLAFLAAAVTTPLGMLMSYPFVSGISPSSLGVVLALSAGALIYVGATHLLPRAEQEHRKYGLFALGGGVLVAVIIVASKA